MADTFTTRLRLQQPTVGGDNNTWGGITNTDWQLVDDAVSGTTTKDLTGLTTYTLTVNNGTTDQARSMLYIFSGTLSADCTVIVPQTAKLGLALNQTSGGHNVILSYGFGNTLTLPNSGGGATPARPFYNDAGTGIYDLQFGQNSLALPGYQKIPGGMVMQWGSATTNGSGVVAVTFPVAFQTACFGVTLTINDWGGTGTVHNLLASESPSTTGVFVGSFDSITGNQGGPLQFRWFAYGH